MSYNIIETLINAGDYIGSFCYNFMLMDYSFFNEFIVGNVPFTFTTFIGNVVQYQVPNISILDGIVDALMQPIIFLFYPNTYLSGTHTPAEVPMYICFISFFINIILTLGLFKLGQLAFSLVTSLPSD